MPRALRSRSGTPTSISSSRICRLSDGCAVYNCISAALVKLPSSATATKYRRCRSSIREYPCLASMAGSYKVLVLGGIETDDRAMFGADLAKLFDAQLCEFRLL